MSLVHGDRLMVESRRTASLISETKLIIVELQAGAVENRISPGTI